MKGLPTMAQKISPHDLFMPEDGIASVDMRRAARAAGLPFYQIRVSCRNGHRSPRATATGQCVACVARRHRQWKLRNPARARERTNDHLRALGKAALPVVGP